MNKDIEIDNNPHLWANDFPFPLDHHNKYDRGHAIIVGGDINCTGAAKLAALAALRTAAGIVTIASPKNALAIYASALSSIMAKPVTSVREFASFIEDKRKTSILIGPGNGVNNTTKQKVITALNMKKKCVIDADAITVFTDNPQELFSKINSPVILTPHMGEFKRIFTTTGYNLKDALNAAKISNAIIVLKGHETIIASPSGDYIINKNAPETLATAGSGDVLAGIITGIMANNISKMDSFNTACAGVWIHTKCARELGYGLIAEDLPTKIPEVLTELNSYCSAHKH